MRPPTSQHFACRNTNPGSHSNFGRLKDDLIRATFRRSRSRNKQSFATRTNCSDSLTFRFAAPIMALTTLKRRSMTAIPLPGLVDPHDLSADRQFCMNLARGMEVLRAFTARDPVLGNREISDRTGLPKPTVSRLTYTLMLLGYLSRDAGSQKYRLGTGVLSLGHPLLASMRVRQAARPLIEQLARKTGWTVNLGMRDRANVVYIDSVRADPANQHMPDIGSTRPLLRTSIGRVLIAACPPAERTAILNRLKAQDPALFEQHRATWEADQKMFAAHGFCRSRAEWQKDLYGVAVPVRLPPREVPVAMSCTLVADPMPKDKLMREVVSQLMETVRQLEGTQGAR